MGYSYSNSGAEIPEPQDSNFYRAGKFYTPVDRAAVGWFRRGRQRGSGRLRSRSL